MFGCRWRFGAGRRRLPGNDAQRLHHPSVRCAATSPLNDLAQARNQSLAQTVLAWLLKDERVTSMLTGASKPEQLYDSLRCLEYLAFSAEELAGIEGILRGRAPSLLPN